MANQQQKDDLIAYLKQMTQQYPFREVEDAKTVAEINGTEQSGKLDDRLFDDIADAVTLAISSQLSGNILVSEDRVHRLVKRDGSQTITNIQLQGDDDAYSKVEIACTTEEEANRIAHLLSYVTDAANRMVLKEAYANPTRYMNSDPTETIAKPSTTTVSDAVQTNVDGQEELNAVTVTAPDSDHPNGVYTVYLNEGRATSLILRLATALLEGTQTGKATNNPKAGTNSGPDDLLPHDKRMGLMQMRQLLTRIVDQGNMGYFHTRAHMERGFSLITALMPEISEAIDQPKFRRIFRDGKGEAPTIDQTTRDACKACLNELTTLLKEQGIDAAYDWMAQRMSVGRMQHHIFDRTITTKQGDMWRVPKENAPHQFEENLRAFTANEWPEIETTDDAWIMPNRLKPIIGDRLTHYFSAMRKGGVQTGAAYLKELSEPPKPTTGTPSPKIAEIERAPQLEDLDTDVSVIKQALSFTDVLSVMKKQDLERYGISDSTHSPKNRSVDLTIPNNVARNAAYAFFTAMAEGKGNVKMTGDHVALGPKNPNDPSSPAPQDMISQKRYEVQEALGLAQNEFAEGKTSDAKDWIEAAKETMPNGALDAARQLADALTKQRGG